MTDPATWAVAATALAGITILSTATLSGWRDWIALQVRRLDGARGPALEGGPPAAARIELADLKERIRKLEAIAAGIDP